MSERVTLRVLRELTGLTQAQLTERMGCKQPEVSRIENRDFSRVRLHTLFRYVTALGGSVEIIVKINGEEFVVDPKGGGRE